MKFNKGDIFNLTSKKTTITFQFILKDAVMGELIRIFPPGVRLDSEPFDVTDVKELFYVFFPLAAAIRKKIAVKLHSTKKLDNLLIPKYMKTPFQITDDGQIESWSIFELATGHQIVKRKLNKKEIAYSPYECWNDTQIIDAVKSQWNPGNLKKYL